MVGKFKFRQDPLYRAIEETEEMRKVEGKLKPLFVRLKKIDNLGIIPEVFEMAKYPKYEHARGTVYQVNKLLENTDKNEIPESYREPLKLASLFLHLGHFPYTYSTERALLLASNLGDRNKENKSKKYILNKIKTVLKNLDEEEGKKIDIDKIFHLEDYKILYKFFSAEILVKNWEYLRQNIDNLKDEDIKIIILDLIHPKNDGYKFLNLTDKADFVQRDALYFGTVRIDISPQHLYAGISRYYPRFSVNEEKLIEYNLRYLTERFYHNSDVTWFSRLYEKILAVLITSKNFKMGWLENYNDEQFKRLICDNYDKENNKAKLSSSWSERAKSLFNNKFSYSEIFDLEEICFPKEKDAIDIEYLLIGKKESQTGLLTYPFNEGILFDVSYTSREEYTYFMDPKSRFYSIKVFQDDFNKHFDVILKFIRNISRYLPLFYAGGIRERLGNQLSRTGRVRFDNKDVRTAIAKAIIEIERSKKYKKGEFIKKYFRKIHDIKKFNTLWLNFTNKYIWEYEISQIERKTNEKLSDYQDSLSLLLFLPVQLLQYRGTKKYLSEIYSKLSEMISTVDSNEKKGHIFEALCLVEKIKTKKGMFQFFLNDMVVIDPEKPRNEQDDNEFDIIELVIDEKRKVHCWIYACSIADAYNSENQKKITGLADYIHSIFPKLIIHTRYMIPEDKNVSNWDPKEEDAGRNYNEAL